MTKQEGFVDQRHAPDRLAPAETSRAEEEYTPSEAGGASDVAMPLVDEEDLPPGLLEEPMSENEVPATESRAGATRDEEESSDEDFDIPPVPTRKRKAEEDEDLFASNENVAYAVHAVEHILNLPPEHHWRKPLRDEDLIRLRAFYAEDRLETPAVVEWKRKRKKNFKSKKAKEDAGKLLRYNKASDSVRKGLDESRITEWEKWKKFNAAEDISDEEA